MKTIVFLLFCMCTIHIQAQVDEQEIILPEEIENQEGKLLNAVFKQTDRIPVKDMKPCEEGFALWQCTFPNLSREYVEERKTALIASLVNVESRAEEKIACVEVWFSEYLYVDDTGNLISIIGLYFFLKEGESPDLILNVSKKVSEK